MDSQYNKKFQADEAFPQRGINQCLNLMIQKTHEIEKNQFKGDRYVYYCGDYCFPLVIRFDRGYPKPNIESANRSLFGVNYRVLYRIGKIRPWVHRVVIFVAIDKI